MEKQTLTKEELDLIKDLREGFTNITTNLGNIEMQIMNLELEKENLKEKLKNLKSSELNLAENLKGKYGDGNISLETGEFTPFETENISSVD